jgi:hypothetical protein
VRNAVFVINLDPCFSMSVTCRVTVALLVLFLMDVLVRYFFFCLLTIRVYVGSSPG